MDPNFFVHSQSADVLPVFSLLLIIFFVLVGLIVTVIKVLVFCKIFSRAGYSWALGLLMLVPIANIIMPFVLAFGDWPIQKELRLLRQQQENRERKSYIPVNSDISPKKNSNNED